MFPAITSDSLHKYLLKAALPVLLHDRYVVKGDWDGSKCVCISFDCDTDEDMDETASVLYSLRNMNFCASFALVGNLAIKYPDVVREIIRNGHEIVNHTVTHPDSLDGLQDVDVEKEILEFQILMSENFGYRPKGFRAPHLMRRKREYLFHLLRENSMYDSSYVGYGAKIEEAIVELPLTPCPDHPRICFDYWHHFQLPLFRCSMEKFISLWRLLLTTQSLVNVYLDPQIASSGILERMVESMPNGFKLQRLKDIASLTRRRESSRRCT